MPPSTLRWAGDGSGPICSTGAPLPRATRRLLRDLAFEERVVELVEGVVGVDVARVDVLDRLAPVADRRWPYWKPGSKSFI